jgi:hypothetical protein
MEDIADASANNDCDIIFFKNLQSLPEGKIINIELFWAICRLFSKSINKIRVQVSNTGETRALNMGMAILAIIARIQSADENKTNLRVFPLLVTQHSCRNRHLIISKRNLVDNLRNLFV